MMIVKVIVMMSSNGNYDDAVNTSEMQLTHRRCIVTQIVNSCFTASIRHQPSSSRVSSVWYKFVVTPVVVRW